MAVFIQLEALNDTTALVMTTALLYSQKLSYKKIIDASLADEFKK